MVKRMNNGSKNVEGKRNFITHIESAERKKSSSKLHLLVVRGLTLSPRISLGRYFEGKRTEGTCNEKKNFL